MLIYFKSSHIKPHKRTFMQNSKSVGALCSFLPVITVKTLLSSRSASSCKCLGSCERSANSSCHLMDKEGKGTKRALRNGEGSDLAST